MRAARPDRMEVIRVNPSANLDLYSKYGNDYVAEIYRSLVSLANSAKTPRKFFNKAKILHRTSTSLQDDTCKENPSESEALLPLLELPRHIRKAVVETLLLDMAIKDHAKQE